MEIEQALKDKLIIDCKKFMDDLGGDYLKKKFGRRRYIWDFDLPDSQFAIPPEAVTVVIGFYNLYRDGRKIYRMSQRQINERITSAGVAAKQPKTTKAKPDNK